ncbi:MAG TPA: branched-chain amino acid ABC transporter permease [Syntrophorhabdales bacterium]|nr:branched-chain amino acid ABC transporter permease [Syntrophorhabdales bacterium]
MKTHKAEVYATLALFFLVAIFPLLDGNRYHLNVGIMVACYSIIAIGLNLLLGNTGQVSIGQAAFYGIGAYASAILVVKVGLSFWLALPCSGLIAGLVGYFLGFTSVRFKGSYLAMATLSFGVIFSIIVLEWTGLTGGAGGYPENIPRPEIGSFKLDTEFKYFYLVWAFVLAIFICTRNLVRSRVGRALYAINENETAAGVIGISATRYKLKVFTISAVYAGLAGSLYAHYATYISEESFTFFFSVTLLCMVVIGGLGSPLGSIIGTAVLVLLSESIRYAAKLALLPQPIKTVLAEYSYHLLLYGFFLLMFAIFIPRGIAGFFERPNKQEKNEPDVA